VSASIKDLLIDRGEKLYRAPRKLIQFTKNPEADALLNDLDRYPHAFVLGCVMDRQIRAERAWIIPHTFSKKLGGFKFATLAQLTLQDVQNLMTKPEPLHRFSDDMSRNFYEATRRIGDRYEGNAARIWTDQPSSAEAVFRFLQFRGVGPKIATMATNILAREFKVPFADHYSIDISADVHVRRVFGRLGLAEPDAGIEEIVYRARALNPTFPGLLDLPTWEIGRSWCHSRNPTCQSCYMENVCPTAGKIT